MRKIFVVLLMVFAISCSNTSEVTVLHNINGYSITNQGLIKFDAFAMQDGKILSVGNHSEIILAYSSATSIDGQGRTVLPGLIDAHAHVMGLGSSILNVNVMGIRTLDETLQMVSDYAAQYPDLAWIQGRGWNQVLWPENSFPTSADLDRAESERPVFLIRVDGHAGWANSAAMRIAGITRDTPDPDGGTIIKDENGEPTGVLIDLAQNLVEKHIPSPTKAEMRLALEASLNEMKSMGLTGVHDAGVGVTDFELMKEMADQGKMTTRIYGMISGAGETFDELSKNGPVIGYADDRLFLRSVKLYSDGALGSRGAALIEDYSDDPGNSGLLFATEEEFTAMIDKVVQAGYQAGIHAIGDRGNRVILNAFENVQQTRGDQGLRHRIEHSQIVNLDDISRFKELNIIASMQPTHATSDMNMAEDRLGPVRILGGYAWRTFLNQGTVIAAGSDFPVELSNPFHGLYSAVTRQDHEGMPVDGWHPEQRITREEALHGYRGFN